MLQGARRREGFTLIEVTLAIVIGVIMIAGAVLIYNQAKTSAGNTRAITKVHSIQACVENFMANSSGSTPDIVTLRALWKRQRPDDWGKSPWGGVNAPMEFPAGTETNGVVNGADIAQDSAEINSGIIGSDGQNGGALRNAPAGEVWTGGLIYYQFTDANDRAIWDATKLSFASVKHYAVASMDSLGDRWYYVKTNGGAKGAGSQGQFDVQGQVQVTPP